MVDKKCTLTAFLIEDFWLKVYSQWINKLRVCARTNLQALPRFCSIFYAKKQETFLGYLGCWTFWGSSFSLVVLFWGLKFWPHLGLPITNIPEYPAVGRCVECVDSFLVQRASDRVWKFIGWTPVGDLEVFFEVPCLWNAEWFYFIDLYNTHENIRKKN